MGNGMTHGGRFPGRAWLVGALAVLCASCGGPAAQSACATSIKGQLLNPETAQVLDFTKLTEEEVQSRVTSAIKDSFGQRETYGLEEAAAKDAVKKMAAEVPNAEPYSARVRAEGAQGNTITAGAICFSNAKNVNECNCEVLPN